MSASRYKSLYSSVSPLGDRIEVIQQGAVIQLRVNGVWQGEVDRRSELLLPTPYMQQMLLSLCYTAQMRRFLVIGLGTGRLPMALHAVLPRARVDVVEIDPVIAGLAKRFFGVRTVPNMPAHSPGIRIYVEDGIAFIANTRRTYDVIFVDAFSGGELPEGLRSRRTLYHLRNRLAPGGVLAMNMSRLDVFAVNDIVEYMTSLFGSPDVYDPKNDERHDDLNLVLLTPTVHNARRLRERRQFLHAQEELLGMDVDLLLQNRLPISALDELTQSFSPHFLG